MSGSRGPKENGHPPAVDPLFRIAARIYAPPSVIGVALSGGLDCGSAGLPTIKARGGVAAVRHPNDAACPEIATTGACAGLGGQTWRAGELAPVVAYYTLDRRGAIVESNLSGAAFLRRPRSQLIGSRLSDYCADRDSVIALEAHLKVVLTRNSKAAIGGSTATAASMCGSRAC